MSTQQELTESAIEVIDEYIRPNSNLLAMERIHRAVFEEEIEFESWNEIRDIYSDIEWHQESLKEFSKIAKEIVEYNTTSISESYFSIESPRQINIPNLVEELEETRYDPESAGRNRDGFEFEVENEIISGRYIYTDVDTKIDYSGGITRLVSEGSISFRFDTDLEVLIVNSTTVTDIQRMKKAIGQLTDFRIITPSQDSERTDLFSILLEELREHHTEEHLSVLSVDEVGLKNQDLDRDISELEISLDSDVLNHPAISSRLDEGWIVNKIEMSVSYADNLFTVRFGLNDMMNYIAIEGVTKVHEGNALMDEVRPIFIGLITD